MRFALPVAAGLAGLLLGGPVVAPFGVLLGHAAIRLRILARSGGPHPDARRRPAPHRG